MRPHVALGMPLGVLPATDERFELGIIVHPSRLAQELESFRGNSPFDEQLLPFAEQAFRGKSLRRHAAADAKQVVRGREVEARQELHGAEDAQGIFRKMGRNRPEQPRRQIVPPLPRVEARPRQRVQINGVDGEIAPRRGVRERQIGVEIGRESLVSEPEFRLAPRQRHVYRHALELDDAKGSADQVERIAGTQGGEEPLLGESVDLEIKVLRRLAPQGVPHAPADEKRAPAGGLHQFRHAAHVVRPADRLNSRVRHRRE